MTARPLFGALALLLAGCALRAPLPPAGPTTAPLPSREQSLERDYRSRALALMREGRWADAEVQWELLLLLRPAPEYRSQLETARKNIAETAQGANALAAAARKRGDLETATTQYLRALAADHDNAVAAQGLREIERERMRRAYLNRPPRNMLGVIMGKPGAPPETEADYVQRQRSGSGSETAAPRR